MNQIKNIDRFGHKYYKDKKDNLRLAINKIHNNKLSDDYLTKVNYSNKAYNSNNINKDYYFKFDKNENSNGFYNIKRSDIIDNNHEAHTYINKNFNKKKNLSNKCLNEKKKMSICYKLKILKEDKKNTELNNTNKNSLDKNNLNEIKRSKWINSNNILTNISKINMSSLPSITIDMNILNKNNMKYLIIFLMNDKIYNKNKFF